MLEWTGERCLPWVEDAQIRYEHLHRYAFAAQFVENKTVLDLACGEGYGSYMLVKKAKHVIGLDIDEKTINHASSKYFGHNLEFLKGSATDIPIKGAAYFDVIVCFEAIEHIKEHDKLLSEIKRVLKDDGLLIISTPNKTVYTDAPQYNNPFHVKELYFNEFKTLLATYFKYLCFMGQRIYAGSNMWNISSTAEIGSTEFVVLNNRNEFHFAGNELKAPMYFIGLASNREINLPVQGSSWLIDISDTLIKDYQKQIGELRAVLAEKTEQVGVMGRELAEKGKRVEELSRDVEERDRQIGELRAVLAEKDLRLSQLQIQIQQSISLRLQAKYQRVIEKLLRPGTRRRYYYELGLTGIRVILDEGWKSFFIKTRFYFKFHFKGFNNLFYRKKYRRNNNFKIQKKFDKNITLSNNEEIIPDENNTVSVIIPVKNGANDLKLLLPVLCSQIGLKNLEIIIVDSGSTDESLSIARAYGAKILTIPAQDFSHSLSRNIGAQEAKSNYLFFTTQDALPSSNTFIYRLLKAMKKTGAVAVSCREFCREDADLFYRVSTWYHFNQFLNISHNDKILSLPQDLNYITLRKNAQISDIACIIKKDIFDKYRFRGNHAEDLDLGIRLIKDNYKLALLGFPCIIHSHRRPAKYWLKRAYVDTLTLADMFCDFQIPDLQSHKVFESILMAYYCFSHLLKNDLNSNGVAIDTGNYFDNIEKKLRLYAQDPIKICDNTIFEYGGLEEEFEKLLIYAGKNSGKLSLNDTFILNAILNHLKIVRQYLNTSYPRIDDTLLDELRSCFVCVCAWQTGAHLAFARLKGLKINDMHNELIKGI